MDYIKTLPTWRLRAAGQPRLEASCEKADEETRQHSDKERKEPPHGSSSHKKSLCSVNFSSQLPACSDVDASGGRACACAAESSRNGSSLSADRAVKDNCVASDCVSNHQHCDWSMWPCDMLQCSECVVCLETFVSEEVLMGLPCGHAFHQQCIVVWLAAGRHCCPVCRWPSYKKKQQRAQSSSDNTVQDWGDSLQFLLFVSLQTLQPSRIIKKETWSVSVIRAALLWAISTLCFHSCWWAGPSKPSYNASYLDRRWLSQ